MGEFSPDSALAVVGCSLRNTPDVLAYFAAWASESSLIRSLFGDQQAASPRGSLGGDDPVRS